MIPCERYAEADIPTRHGPFRLVVYRFGVGATEEHVAVVRGDVRGGQGVLARVHSECMTGEVLGSLKCDCREQLDAAMAAIAAAGKGVIVYLRQEGRGIGLGNKIRAYALQAEGKDTVEANLALGFAADLRSYEQAAAILADLGVASVALMTNNPDKIAGLERAGAVVAEQVPHWITGHEHNRDYLEVKRAKMGHLEPKKR
jgi:3,4-dihydroxy 2-butanone 4-phosphate synthase/GTP cyclohydrolase II